MNHPFLENHDDTVTFIVVVKWQGQFDWYCSMKEDWILNQKSYSQALGIENYLCSDRYGICILSEATIQEFKKQHQMLLLDLPTLADWFSQNLPLRSYDQDSRLFPTLFIDFDERSLYSVYGESFVFETYVPKGWNAQTVFFADLLPPEQRYWIHGGKDWWETMRTLAAQTGPDDGRIET